MKKAPSKKRQGPVQIVRLHNFSVPIYRRTEIKNGTAYDGFVFSCMQGGRRVQIRRSTKEKAVAAAEDAIRLMDVKRTSAFAVGADEYAEIAAARQILRQHPHTTLVAALTQWSDAQKALGTRGTIPGAVAAFLAEQARGVLPQISVPALVDIWIDAKEQEGVSEYYLRDAARKLRRFASAFKCPVASVTPPEIAEWIARAGMRGRNANNVRNTILALFSFAARRGFLPREQKHAAELVDRVKERPSAIGIYSPGEMVKILSAAPAAMIPAIAIAGFAGLRSAEIFRLDWSEVRLDRRHILVDAGKAKTAQRRLAPITENLAAWLAPFVKAKGRVCPDYRNLDNFTRRFAVICAAAHVKPQQNGFRHSFASYRLPVVESADRLALEMGNSPRKIFTNYRQLVTREDADRWFAIMPQTAGAKVVQMVPRAA
jgi:integrase